MSIYANKEDFSEDCEECGNTAPLFKVNLPQSYCFLCRTCLERLLKAVMEVLRAK